MMKTFRSMIAFCAAVMLLLLTVIPAHAQSVPYLQKIKAGQPIYKGPGYFFDSTESVVLDGTYTIVEEYLDDNNALWGRLKSGAGWVDLSDVRGEYDAVLTMTVQEPDPYFVGLGSYEMYLQEDSEYTVWITFDPSEVVKNVQFVSFRLSDMGMSVDQVLYTLPELEPGVPLLAGVVFYGDMTTYGLMCTDADGYQKCYTVYQSGYDGSLVVTECELVVVPMAGRN